LDVERILLEVRLPAPEADAGLHEALEHPHVIDGPDVARPPEDDRAGQPVAPPEQLAVGGPIRLDAAGRFGAGVVPRAEGGHVEVAHLHDVDDEAAAIPYVLAGHIGADDAAMLLRGGLDRVHRGLLRDQVAALGDVAGGVDVRDARTQVLVDDDALVDLHGRALEPLEICLDPGGPRRASRTSARLARRRPAPARGPPTSRWRSGSRRKGSWCRRRGCTRSRTCRAP